MKKIVIALGGNALQEAGKPATAEAQLEVVEKTSEYIADIIGEGYKVIIAHGNGPQVGRIVLQNEYANPVSPAMPFDVCGAMSQGYIGYHIQQGLTKVLRSRGNKSNVATVVTQVLVDRNDPKFKNPSNRGRSQEDSRREGLCNEGRRGPRLEASSCVPNAR